MPAPLSDYPAHDALALAELVRQREVTPLELTDAAIARIEALDPKLNAVVMRLFDRARTAARQLAEPDPYRLQPLRGVPFLLKDLLQTVAGLPTSHGSRFLSTAPMPHDSELWKRYQAAGVVLLGKTNTPELGLLPVTEPELYGPCRNPWNTGRTTGGSSGGSAAAVAARLVPAAHGGDGGGSIRIPASCCGLFGLKPTRARNPIGPDVGEGWHGIVAEHVLTRSVRDSAAFLDVSQGRDLGAPYSAPTPERTFLDETRQPTGNLRIAFTSHALLGRAQPHPDCVKAVEDAARLCASLGHEVVEATPPVDRHALTRAYLTLVSVETAAELRAAAERLRKPLDPRQFELGTWVLGLIGEKASGVELARAVHSIHAFTRALARWSEPYDVLLTPVLGAPPVEIGALAQKPAEVFALKALRLWPVASVMRKVLDQIADSAFDFASFTAIANLTGQPAMSVPLHWNEQGLPIGVQFIGRYGDEAGLLRLAAQLEAARPWAQRVPPGFG
jgi:amidase